MDPRSDRAAIPELCGKRQHAVVIAVIAMWVMQATIN